MPGTGKEAQIIQNLGTTNLVGREYTLMEWRFKP